MGRVVSPKKRNDERSPGSIRSGVQPVGQPARGESPTVHRNVQGLHEAPAESAPTAHPYLDKEEVLDILRSVKVGSCAYVVWKWKEEASDSTIPKVIYKGKLESIEEKDDRFSINYIAECKFSTPEVTEPFDEVNTLDIPNPNVAYFEVLTTKKWKEWKLRKKRIEEKSEAPPPAPMVQPRPKKRGKQRRRPETPTPTTTEVTTTGLPASNLTPSQATTEVESPNSMSTTSPSAEALRHRTTHQTTLVEHERIVDEEVRELGMTDKTSEVVKESQRVAKKIRDGAKKKDFPQGNRTLPPSVVPLSKEEKETLARLTEMAPYNVTARDLMVLLKLNVPSIPKKATERLAKSTRDEHKRVLNCIARDMPVDLYDKKVEVALVTHFEKMQHQKKWKASTMLKYLISAQGALRILSLYRESPIEVYLSGKAGWKSAVGAAQLESKTQLPDQPQAASQEEVMKAVEAEPNPDIKTAIIMTWITTARIGCALKIRTAGIRVNPNRSMVITFREGKGVRTRGPYSVATAPVPEKWWSIIEAAIKRRPGEQTLIPSKINSEWVKKSLRRVNVKLECRSLRRGSLQTLAFSNTLSDEQLMWFSGHTQMKTLLRYLNWGSLGTQRLQKMHDAGSSLMPTGGQDLRRARA